MGSCIILQHNKELINNKDQIVTKNLSWEGGSSVTNDNMNG